MATFKYDSNNVHDEHSGLDKTMLTNFFSRDSVKKLRQQSDTLMVLPLSGRCEYTQTGVIDTGLSGFDLSTHHEVWQTTEQQIERGSTDNNHWAKTSDILCVSRWVNFDEHVDIESAIRTAYHKILTLLNDKGYPFTLRFWNYLPNINVGQGDEEVYKRFCTGRLQAFEAIGISTQHYPAASALGHYSTGAVIYVLAAKTQPTHFMNTNQVNAYEYPREYGVSSPSFARATAWIMPNDAKKSNASCLFISGTASIVGHKTIYPGDLLGQLQTTANNIEQLMIQTNTPLEKLKTLKVYIRHTEHAQTTRTWLQERFPQAQQLLTHADICRDLLLVEIECFCH